MAGAQYRPNIFILADSQTDNNALYFHGNLRAGVRSRISVMGIKEENKRASRGNDRNSSSVDDTLLATLKIGLYSYYLPGLYLRSEGSLSWQVEEDLALL